jgi:hypothetical protein
MQLLGAGLGTAITKTEEGGTTKLQAEVLFCPKLQTSLSVTRPNAKFLFAQKTSSSNFVTGNLQSHCQLLISLSIFVVDL